QDRQAVVEDADLTHGGDHSGRHGVDAGDGAQRVVDLQLGPGGERRHERDDDRGGVAVRAFLEGLASDEHADVEEDRGDGDDGDDGGHQGDDPEPRQADDHDAGGDGIADAAAHGFPSRVADVDGVDVGVAHEAADQTDHAVRRE